MKGNIIFHEATIIFISSVLEQVAGGINSLDINLLFVTKKIHLYFNFHGKKELRNLLLRKWFRTVCSDHPEQENEKISKKTTLRKINTASDICQSNNVIWIAFHFNSQPAVSKWTALKVKYVQIKRLCVTIVFSIIKSATQRGIFRELLGTQWWFIWSLQNDVFAHKSMFLSYRWPLRTLLQFELLSGVFHLRILPGLWQTAAKDLRSLLRIHLVDEPVRPDRRPLRCHSDALSSMYRSWRQDAWLPWRFSVGCFQRSFTF